MSSRPPPSSKQKQRPPKLASQASTRQNPVVDTTTTIKSIMEGALGTILYIRYLLPKGQMENYSVRKELFPSESQSSPSQIPASQLATQVPDDSLGPSGDGTESMKALHTLRVKRKGGEEGDRIIKYIDGIVDAVGKRYLRRMTFIIYLDEDDPDNIVEAYTFDFAYSESGAELDVTAEARKEGKLRTVGTAKSAMHAGDDEAINQMTIYKSLKKLMRNLNASCKELCDLPTKRFMDFKLDYVDGTPLDYQPPGFRDAGDVHLRMGTTDVHQKPVRWQIGEVDLGEAKVGVRTSSISHNLPPPHYDTLCEIALHRQLDGERLSAKEQERELKRVRQEEDDEVKDHAAKRRVMWTITEDDENEDGARFYHIIPDDDEEGEKDPNVVVILPRYAEREGDLSLKAWDAKMCWKRRRATAEETLPIDLGPNATETQHAPYIDKSFDAELDEELESTQITEAASIPSQTPLTRLESITDLSRPAPAAPDTTAHRAGVKTSKGKSKGKTPSKRTSVDNASDPSASNPEITSDSHTDPSSQEFNPAQDTFRAQRGLARTVSASRTTRSKQNASATTKSKTKSGAANKKKVTPKAKVNGQAKKKSGTAQFGATLSRNPSLSIPAAAAAKKQKKGKAAHKGRPATRANAKVPSPDPIDLVNEEEEEEMMCHCGDPEGEDVLESREPIAIRCEDCKKWYHGTCIGIIRNEKIPPGDYICVMCRAGAAHLFAIDEDRLLWQDNARQLALTRKVLYRGRSHTQFEPLHELADYLGVSMAELEPIHRILESAGFMSKLVSGQGKSPALTQATQARKYINDRATQRQFSHYFTPLGQLENDMFGLGMDAHEMPSSQLPAGSQASQQPAAHHSRSNSGINGSGAQPLFFPGGTQQMESIAEDSPLDTLAQMQMASPSDYGRHYDTSQFDRPNDGYRTAKMTAQYDETIENNSSAWDQDQMRGKAKGKERAHQHQHQHQQETMDDIDSFYSSPTSHQLLQQQAQQGTPPSKGSSRIDRGLAGPFVPDDSDSTNGGWAT